MWQGKWLARLWPLPGLTAAARVLDAALVVGTDHLANFLGHPWVLSHYHLWLAALVVFGPLLQFHISPRIIFANRNNYLYVRFVDSAWGWTLLLSAGFLLPFSVLSRERGQGAPSPRPLLRLGLASGLQLVCLRAFGLLRDASGSCLALAEGGLLLLPEAEAGAWGQAACLSQPGRQWRGYAVSTPCFLLSYSSLVLAEELAPFRAYLRVGRPAPAPVRVLFLLAAALLGLWSGLLVLSAALFHRYSEKLAGAGAAHLCWRLTYRLWYPRRWGPGPPGQELETRAGRGSEERCPESWGQDEWYPGVQRVSGDWSSGGERAPWHWGPSAGKGPGDRGPGGARMQGIWGPGSWSLGPGRDRAPGDWDPGSERIPCTWVPGKERVPEDRGLRGDWGLGPGYRQVGRRCVCGAVQSRWDPASETMCFRE
ncbi:fat storage-inducing transmembrane protein 1 [Hypanus sabinus]|uniref:fat storage-inducing transmembrane protein 1 n=1 Tax=Hypanus sabinus TaxID=79690 RepID=UPI0028C38349|nr:fat storage-inducing transmembrane protein 1 [Hypanus sabinus]